MEHTCLRVEDLLGNRAALCVSQATAKKLIQSRWYTICKKTSYTCELDRQTAMCPSVARRAKRSMTAQLWQGTEAFYERIRLEFLKRLQECLKVLGWPETSAGSSHALFGRAG